MIPALIQTHQSMIEQYDGPLDIALALHACGNATDHVLEIAQRPYSSQVDALACCISILEFDAIQ
jgi:hypothetical protein